MLSRECKISPGLFMAKTQLSADMKGLGCMHI